VWLSLYAGAYQKGGNSMSQSYTTIVEEIRHHFRNDLNHAVQPHDVDEAFARTVRKFLVRALNDSIRFADTDIRLTPGKRRSYELASNISNTEQFITAAAQSDLHAIISDFAEEAGRRRKFLVEREKSLGSQLHAQH
jgi:hypothetical protein